MMAGDVGDRAPELAVRTVMITGATSGLGRAMARALAEAGAVVAMTGRSGERAREAGAEFTNGRGIELDVCDEASVVRAVDEAWSELGAIDMLVNNAGLGMRSVNPGFMTDPQPFWAVSPDGFRAVIDTNLTGYFLIAREAVPRMLKAGHGRIVNISISHSTMNRAGFVPYGPSRAGSEALSRIMAADLADSDVTVNLLLPGGPTLTGMVPDEHERTDVEWLDPAVMGPPIVWLASRDATGIRDARIVATQFESWLSERADRPPESVGGVARRAAH